MKGSKAVSDKNKDNKSVRKELNGAETLGFKIVARPDKGFVHYLPCEFKASEEMLEKAMHRNSTTLVDIRLQRVVHKNVFCIDKMPSPTKPEDFKDTMPGEGSLNDG
jgi:hypothetical protein